MIEEIDLITQVVAPIVRIGVSSGVGDLSHLGCVRFDDVFSEKEFSVGFPLKRYAGLSALAHFCFAATAPFGSLPVAAQFGINALAATLFCAVVWRSGLLATSERAPVVAHIRQALGSIRAKAGLAGLS